MQQLAVTELQAWLSRCRDDGEPAPLLLDVREPWEFALAAIHVDAAETVNLPMQQVPAHCAELLARTTGAAGPAGAPVQPIVCICHHGMRSAQVVAFLARAGFESVYNLAGGIDAWSTQVDAAVPRY